MKNTSILLLLLSFLVAPAFAQQKSAEEFQKETNEQYADEDRSPLLKEDLINFKGLPFFKIDSQFIVIANLELIDKAKPFKMETSTDRRPEYVVYAIASFELHREKLSLNIYKNYVPNAEDDEPYLFLPFTDETSGNDTYGGGRFIDLKITEGNKMVIDFNQAYNPYCAYNHGYSCPIPPKENHLNVRIEAGVKYVAKD